MSSVEQKSPLIVALDYPDSASAIKMAESLDPSYCRVKVGKELYTRCGPQILESLHGLGFEVFLDLKFHDIPNTTANAVAVAADLGVWMVNVHASGGRQMMEACVSKLTSYQKKPLLIAVTVLTSMQDADLHELGLEVSAQQQVNRLAELSRDVGMDGVVCSSHEVAELKANLGADFKLVTPGIRPAFASVGDQKRIMTPYEAVQAGSDYLVIGRPITQADDPMDALSKITKELALG
ncbi:orotidine 5'-phosphate decarboxylase [Oleiphilus sp. HI0081]|nr:orotidine 5'-phosphate decarboxylase [Oleiphilus sp. HI0043]KZY41668.1 orotidine 5'-phosphate decarboxylase [Oleiphilus sp. HI0050]KZY57421.1 orotidine 5'-phosphate decarboxylase [Oleiphilus sp. HI0061]KZY76690.1 orotidine 5'-phosphate decarboxylase [Oleiphilus sp. HI0068]KZY84507.1 orotidine 5'-phosphate decarboxylase [Oleiphilus sp. HI0069]KZY88634.1 orotidine 5'-phosphate decarboxylase [Oleiphilus sp. HI0072]KZZ11513.1 orotidine 5'-phosphate decarboxylase [Oleiphilus sp. HI0078]KZZ2200